MDAVTDLTNSLENRLRDRLGAAALARLRTGESVLWPDPDVLAADAALAQKSGAAELAAPAPATASATGATAATTPATAPDTAASAPSQYPALGAADITDATERLRRFAPYIAQVFPETERTLGIIESPLAAVPSLQQRLRESLNLSGVSADAAAPSASRAREHEHGIRRHDRQHPDRQSPAQQHPTRHAAARQPVAEARQPPSHLGFDQGTRGHLRGAAPCRVARPRCRHDHHPRRLPALRRPSVHRVLRTAFGVGGLDRKPGALDRHHGSEARVQHHGAHVGRRPPVEERPAAPRRRRGARVRGRLLDGCGRRPRASAGRPTGTLHRRRELPPVCFLATPSPPTGSKRSSRRSTW